MRHDQVVLPQGESVDNFNWGVRRPSLSHLEGSSNTGASDQNVISESGNEVTPVLTKRDASRSHGTTEESSDDEVGMVRREGNDLL